MTIRVILRTRIKDGYSGLETDSLSTLDIDSTELEQRLREGGFSENGYHVTEFAGAEVLQDRATQGEPKP